MGSLLDPDAARGSESDVIGNASCEWEPDDRRLVGDDKLYLWIIPARVGGAWSWTTPDGKRRNALLHQGFQKIEGRVEGGGATLVARNGQVNGREVALEPTRGGTGDAPVVERYRGRVNGRTITGAVEAWQRRWNWHAQQ